MKDFKRKKFKDMKIMLSKIILYSNREEKFTKIENKNNRKSSIYSFEDKFKNDFENINVSEIRNTEYSENYFSKIIKQFLDSLFSENEVSIDSIGRIINFINSDYQKDKKSMTKGNFSKLFINSIIGDKKKYCFPIKNYENLKHLANIFNSITINIGEPNSENYDLNFAVIYIASRCFYKKNFDDDLEQNTVEIKNQNENNNSLIQILYRNKNRRKNKSFFNNKQYLSSLLGKHKIYSSKTFWIDLIELKINRKVEEFCKKNSNLNLNPNSTSNSQSNSSSSNDPNKNKKNNNLNENSSNDYFPNNNNNKSSLIGSMGSKIKGLFKNYKSKNDDKNVSSFNVKSKDSNNLNVTRDNSSGLNTTKNSSAYSFLFNNPGDQIFYQEALAVLKEFIINFINFELEITEAMNIIVEIGTKYNFPKERISLYVTMLNTNSFSIKCNVPNFTKEKDKQNEKNYEKYSFSEGKSKLIEMSLSYLEPQSINSVLLLNKEMNKSFKKKLVKEMLLRIQPNDIKNRIRIWKYVLKTVRIIFIKRMF